MAASPTPAAAPAYATTRRTVGILLLGRAAYRGLWLLAPLLLATTWSAADIGRTVAAVGTFGWLVMLLSSAEKTALKQVPRLPRLANQILRTMVAIVVIPLVVALPVAVGWAVLDADSALWPWAVVWALTGAVVQVLASMHRIEHRNWADALTFVGGAGWLLTATGLTIALGWRPLTWLIVCEAGMLVIIGVGLVACRGRLRVDVRRRAANRPLRRSLLLLGLPETLSLASVGAGYAMISLVSQPHEAAWLYIAVTAAGVIGSMVAYVVRVRSPEISLRLRGAGAITGERQARRLAERALLGGIGFGLLGILAAVATSLPWLVLAVFTVGEIVIFAQRTVAANLVENSRSRWLQGNVRASATGLVTAVVVMAVATPVWGAAGAMGGLLAGQIANAAYLRWLLTPRGPRSGPVPPAASTTATASTAASTAAPTTVSTPRQPSACPSQPPAPGVDMNDQNGDPTTPADGPDRTGLSVVIPCYNEADVLDDTLDEVLAELGHLDLQVVCVDDGSKDATLDILRRRAAADPRVDYLSFTRNFGVEAAFSAGYLYSDKPWLAHIDADGQFPPAEVHQLIEASPGQDAVFGVRAERNDPWLRKAGSAVNQFVARRMLGIELPAGATCFRLIRTDLARAVVNLRLGSPYFLATLPQLTDRWRTVPIQHRARADGPARVRFFQLAGQAMDLWFAFSRRPAHIAIMASAWAAVLATLLGLLHLVAGTPRVLVEGGLAVLVGVALLVIAVEVRCLGVITASQPRPRQFYIRESTMQVDPDDSFTSTEATTVQALRWADPPTSAGDRTPQTTKQGS